MLKEGNKADAKVVSDGKKEDCDQGEVCLRLLPRYYGLTELAENSPSNAATACSGNNTKSYLIYTCGKESTCIAIKKINARIQPEGPKLSRRRSRLMEVLEHD